VYRKSILYLVSRAFEGARDGGEVPILGMAKFAGTKLKDGRTLRDAIVAAKGGMVESRAFTPFNGRCDAVSHVDFDTNMATMTSVLLRILGMPESSGPENFYERSLPIQ
jgi:hypothetical protein